MSARLPAAGARGITLLELLLVVFIMSLLAALALPLYHRHLLRAQRADALAALLPLQQAQERWRALRPSYSAMLAELKLPDTSPRGRYRLSLGSASPSGYVAQATAQGAQAQDSDCRVFTLQHQQGITTHAATNAAGADSTAQCWAR